MRNIFLALFSLAVFTVSNSTFALDGEEQLYAELLTNNNSAQIKAAAQSIYNKKIRSVVLTDLVAEVLLQSVDGSVSLDEDTQAWLAKTLGGSTNSRYKNILVSIENSDVSSKIKKYAKKARKNLIKTSNEAYVEGGVNIKTFLLELTQQKKSYIAKVTNDKFTTIAKGDTLKNVIDKIGLPNNVNVIYGTRHQAWVGRISYSMLKFEYEGIGALKFEYFSEPLEDWAVATVGIFSEFKGALSGHSMMNQNPGVMRSYIQTIMKQGNATKLDYDIAAERLYRDINDESFTDTLSWACKLLATSGDSSYRKVLKNTVDNSPTRKLRKYAEKALKHVKQGDNKEYLSGDVFKLVKEKVAD